jgi:hypothetical protein
MRRLHPRRPTPAMAVAVVALVAALSGSAIALPGGNTVDSGDIRRGAVKSSDIGPSAVTGAKIRPGSVTGADVRDGSLTGADVGEESLTGADIGADSLTGADVAESSLGKVPAATAADSATTATNAGDADTVDGQHASDIVAAGKPLTAFVTSDCAALSRGNGAVSIGLAAPARCDVRLNRDIQSCIPQVTHADDDFAGELNAFLAGDSTGFLGLDANEVAVIYRTSAGGVLAASRPAFYLVVHC